MLSLNSYSQVLIYRWFIENATTPPDFIFFWAAIFNLERSTRNYISILNKQFLIGAGFSGVEY